MKIKFKVKHLLTLIMLILLVGSIYIILVIPFNGDGLSFEDRLGVFARIIAGITGIGCVGCFIHYGAAYWDDDVF